MTTVNYPNPVTVNGYSCKNCTEVDEAKKHIDPAHPKDGPYGVDAKTQAAAVTIRSVTRAALGRRLGGVQRQLASAATQGLRLDISA